MADGTEKMSGRDYEFSEPTIRREPTVRSENLSGELKGESGESQPIQSDFICRHHNEPRVPLHVPKGETFTIPLKYIDVTRSTHTDLDVMQEKRVDDNRNVDSNRSLSDS